MGEYDSLTLILIRISVFRCKNTANFCYFVSLLKIGSTFNRLKSAHEEAVVPKILLKNEH